MYLSSMHHLLEEEEEEEGKNSHRLPKFRHPRSHQVNQLSVSHKVSQPQLLVSQPQLLVSQPQLLVSSHLVSHLVSHQANQLVSRLASQPVSSQLSLSPHHLWWLQGNHSREVKVREEGRGRVKRERGQSKHDRGKKGEGGKKEREERIVRGKGKKEE